MLGAIGSPWGSMAHGDILQQGGDRQGPPCRDSGAPGCRQSLNSTLGTESCEDLLSSLQGLFSFISFNLHRGCFALLHCITLLFGEKTQRST